MANPRIEVEIGAVIDGLKKGFGESVKIIDTLEKQAQELEKALRDATSIEQISTLNQDLARTRSALSQLRTTGIDPLVKSTEKLSKATNEYNSVGTNFNRLVQDAPFGIIGISNNITSLAESFGDARNKGKSFTQILGGIFSSGNLLGLGISALTSAFVLLQQKGLFKTEESAKSLKDKLDEYQDTLTGVAAATLKGSQNAQQEAATLNALRIQAENVNLSQKDRLLAVEKLQSEYPSYFGNLTKEQILNGQVGTAYQEVTKQLIAKAKAQASVNQIAENSIKLLTIETKLEELKTKRLVATSDAQAQLDALITKRQQDGFLTQGDIARYDELLRRINQANESQGEELQLLEEKLSILNTNKSLEENINSIVSSGVSLVDEKNKKLKENVVTLEDITKKWNENEEAILRNLKAQRQISATPEQAFQNVAGRLTGKEGDVAFNDPIKQAQDKIAQSLAGGPPIEEFVEKYKQVAEQTNETTEALIGGFSALGNQIASSLNIGNEAFKGFIATVLSNTPKIIAAIFKQAAAKKAASAGEIATNSQVAASEGIAVATKAANALGPVGLALLPVFIGGALALISGAFNKSSGGGGKVGSVGASGLGSATSFSGGGQGLPFGGNSVVVLETVVRGEDILFVSQQANNRINKG